MAPSLTTRSPRAADTSVVVLFTGLYLAIDGKGSTCGLAAAGSDLDMHTALAFSIETMTTIGYGLPHDNAAFFSGCFSLTIAVYAQALVFLLMNPPALPALPAQALVFLLMNAGLVGIIFTRVGHATTRANQIIFSDKAAIRCVRGRFYLTLQACPCRRPHAARRRPHAACRRAHTDVHMPHAHPPTCPPALPGLPGLPAQVVEASFLHWLSN